MGIKKFVALLASATLGLGLVGVAAAPSANAAIFTPNNANPFNSGRQRHQCPDQSSSRWRHRHDVNVR